MSLLSKNLEQLKAASGYQFSATKVGDLGAAEYTLASLVVDTSGSVAAFLPQLEGCAKTVLKAMQKSPRADNLMFRFVSFDDALQEKHGFKLLNTISEKDYTGILQIGGMTALFESMDEAIQATATYGKQLTAQDFTVNGIVVVVTDGQNNRGRIMDASVVKMSLETARKSECLESILVILVGVTNDDTTLDFYLKDVKDNAGCDQYISIGTATPGKIAKLAQFISQSISSTSSSLGTGKPSQPLNPSQFNF
jgi:uncharacterized protein YegL